MDEDLKKILKFVKERDWEQYHLPKNVAASLAIEASEILEIFQWTKDHKIPKERAKELEEELADVYYWLLLMSHIANVDIRKAFVKKMKKNEGKYPISKAKGISTKYTELR